MQLERQPGEETAGRKLEGAYGFFAIGDISVDRAGEEFLEGS